MSKRPVRMFSHTRTRLFWVLLAIPATPLDVEGQGERAQTAAEVHARAVAAQGGASALASHQSLHVQGRIEIAAQGLTGTVESWRRRPGLTRSRAEFAGVGTIESGYDGTVAWSKNPMLGSRVLEGAELAAVAQDAMWSDDPTAVRSRTLVGEEEFEGRTCVVLRLVMKSGDERTSYYDLATGLPAGAKVPRPTPQGEQIITVIVSDYRDVGGVKLPFRTAQRLGPVEQVLIAEHAEWDVNADLSVFELPADIRALVSK